MKGELLSVDYDFRAGNYSFTISCPKSEIDYLEGLKGKEVSVDIKEWKKKRSLNANALFWKCVGELAEELRTDKWKIYLSMLKRYGQFTYICVKPSAVEAVKKQWRETEELGEININGKKAVQLLCYFGSSTYDSKEFSVLLDGTISEMKEIGIPYPGSEEIERALKMWEKVKSRET